MKKYNQYSIEYIKKLIEKGKKHISEYDSLDELIHFTDYTLPELEFVQIGFCFPDFTPEAKYFLRIGEPTIDESNCYRASYNYADDKREAGVSVVSTTWLHSLKSVFFNTTDENIAQRGVYKIYGFQLPQKGGDDEPLICPLDWAKKTKIRTREGLEKAVKKLQ